MESSKALLTPKEVCYPDARNEAEENAIEELKHNANFAEACTFGEQVGIPCSILRTENCRISYSKIADMFNDNKGTIKDKETKFINGVMADGCPPLFTNEELDMIFHYIDNALDNN